ncbi:MAG: hypothetical protein A2798_03065 [Candidatus Levybacteria bacterium RIFCSPHIGHO2_01_FULL_37_17]|nr:MAG: hypothetical protein A2798_03065 [Candidatus Levybacteria bacterium RIFCSPHIGHO2_01_FULL_37_17]OGH36835.1 MAG: hypothetical protein A2959_01055 [Candidatus Levybacteria bacterium RIFCSPLOWO2_01_FULL_38_23]
MKQEKVILSFVAILIGLAVTGAAFFLYQNSKKIITPTAITKIIAPTPASSFYLILDEPKNESLADKKSIKVSGRTLPTAIVVIITKAAQEVLLPSSIGNFSTTIQIEEGINYLRVSAIDKNGETQTIERVIGYTTEDF